MSRAPRARGLQVEGAVLLVEDGYKCPLELEAAIAQEGFWMVRLNDITSAPVFVLSGGVTALVIGPRPLGPKEMRVVQRCRAICPTLGVVVTAIQPSQADLKRALESSATAFLPWPAPAPVVRQALRSGQPVVSDSNVAIAPEPANGQGA